MQQHDWLLDPADGFVGMNGFGAPPQSMMSKFGITEEAVVTAV